MTTSVFEEPTSQMVTPDSVCSSVELSVVRFHYRMSRHGGHRRCHGSYTCETCVYKQVTHSIRVRRGTEAE